MGSGSNPQRPRKTKNRNSKAEREDDKKPTDPDIDTQAGESPRARRGGGKTGRKLSKDALENAQRRVAEARKERDRLRTVQNKTPESKEAIKKAEKALTKAEDALRASENHAQDSQTPPRRN